MKKLLSVLLVLELLLSLVGCLPQESFETTQPELISSSQSQTTLPPQTDPPESTLPPQTDPPETTRPPVTEPPTTRPRPTEPPTTEPPTTEPPTTEPPTTEPEPYLDPDGSYTTKEDVALYIHLYGRLPDNFITKSQAKKLGWKSGSLERYAPGKCIGGDRFGNREGLLPYGHTYYECDIDTLGSYSGRGAKRIVFSTDGLIYYTGDHYQSFTLLYGEP
ncbi:MAG: ribonuclease [Oscillospiraceae bacterium]|nr:ribonuclease [Oscillospiraceae bacterium]